jgi:chromosome segregation ATPase
LRSHARQVDELRAKFAELEEGRETAEREMATIKDRREQLEQMERNRDAVMEYYASAVPESVRRGKGLNVSPRDRLTNGAGFVPASHASDAESPGYLEGPAFLEHDLRPISSYIAR